MRSLRTTLSLLAALVPTVLAGVKFTSPIAGANVAPGTITITWTDDGTAPALSALSAYTFQLMVGGNSDATAQPLTALGGTFSTGNTFSLPVSAGLAGPTPNGFYLKMLATATAGGQMIYYTDRFNMPGMTGTTPTQFSTAAQALSGVTTGPPTQNQLAAAAPGAGGAPAGDPYTVSYYLQTGLTKYAPMQPVPPTKITAQTYTPLFPTSSYSIATAFLPLPTILKTVTASQTFSVESMANTAAPASNPNPAMAKYLARWKD